MKYEWMDGALCAQTDPNLWFPKGPGCSSRTVDRVRAANREQEAA